MVQVDVVLGARVLAATMFLKKCQGFGVWVLGARRGIRVGVGAQKGDGFGGTLDVSLLQYQKSSPSVVEIQCNGQKCF